MCAALDPIFAFSAELAAREMHIGKAAVRCAAYANRICFHQTLSLSLSGWFSRQSHRGAAASAAAAGGAQMQSIFRAHKRGERERELPFGRERTIILLMKNANKNAAAQQIIKKIWLCACEECAAAESHVHAGWKIKKSPPSRSARDGVLIRKLTLVISFHGGAFFPAARNGNPTDESQQFFELISLKASTSL
jgi:hypothetical protein